MLGVCVRRCRRGWRVDAAKESRVQLRTWLRRCYTACATTPSGLTTEAMDFQLDPCVHCGARKVVGRANPPAACGSRGPRDAGVVCTYDVTDSGLGWSRSCQMCCVRTHPSAALSARQICNNSKWSWTGTACSGFMGGFVLARLYRMQPMASWPCASMGYAEDNAYVGGRHVQVHG